MRDRDLDVFELISYFCIMASKSFKIKVKEQYCHRTQMPPNASYN